jgi:hypothetical protein
MHVGSNGAIVDACATRDAALAKQGPHCRWCDLSGQVSIFHKDYCGMPTRRILDHNSEEREVRAVVVAHCSCEVGKWMRSCTKSEDLLRIPPLSAVGHGVLKNWSPVDPRFADIDDTEAPDWKAFLRWLRGLGPNGAVKVVHPQYEGNRNQARREMGITKPTDP